MNIYIFVILFLSLASLLINKFVSQNKKMYMGKALSSNIIGSKIVDIISEHYGLSIFISRSNANVENAFSPKLNCIFLQKELEEEASIASAAIVAHECGHARQSKEKGLWYNFSSLLLKISGIVSMVYYLIFVGYCLTNIITFEILLAGILICIAIDIVKSIFLIPLELDASKKGLKDLIDFGIINNDEISMVQSLLNTAWSTYIIGFVMLLIQLIALLICF